MSQASSAGWLLTLVVSLLFSLIMGLCLVWVSIERTDMAFSLRQLKADVERRAVLQTKLEVERDKLLAPSVLSQKAVQFGMREARPGQIRKFEPVKNKTD